MLLRTTRRVSSFSRTAALEGKLARREASAAIQGKEDAPKLSRADAIEGRLARREAAALLQGAAEASSLTRAEMIEGRLARREAAALVQSLEASPRPNLSRKQVSDVELHAWLTARRAASHRMIESRDASREVAPDAIDATD